MINNKYSILLSQTQLNHNINATSTVFEFGIETTPKGTGTIPATTMTTTTTTITSTTIEKNNWLVMSPRVEN